MNSIQLQKNALTRLSREGDSAKKEAIRLLRSEKEIMCLDMSSFLLFAQLRLVLMLAGANDTDLAKLTRTGSKVGAA